MSEFDVEVKNSIRSMQTAVAGLTKEVEGTNSSLRRMQTEAQGASRHVEGIGHGFHEMGRAARIAGGEAGHVIGHLSHLVGLNPAMLVLGAGMAFVSDQVLKLVEHLTKANEEMEKTAALGAAVARTQRGQEKDALLGVDVQGMRKRGMEADTNPFAGIPMDQREDANRASDVAVQSGLAGSKREALQRIAKSGLTGTSGGAFGSRRANWKQLAAVAAGQGDADPDEFVANVDRYSGSSQGQVAKAAEQAQYFAGEDRERASGERLKRAAGFAGRGDTLGAVAANSEATAHLKAINDNIAKLLEEMRRDRNREGWKLDNPFGSSVDEKLQKAEAEKATFMAQMSAATR